MKFKQHTIYVTAFTIFMSLQLFCIFCNKIVHTRINFAYYRQWSWYVFVFISGLFETLILFSCISTSGSNGAEGGRRGRPLLTPRFGDRTAQFKSSAMNFRDLISNLSKKKFQPCFTLHEYYLSIFLVSLCSAFHLHLLLAH